MSRPQKVNRPLCNGEKSKCAVRTPLAGQYRHAGHLITSRGNTMHALHAKVTIKTDSNCNTTRIFPDIGRTKQTNQNFLLTSTWECSGIGWHEVGNADQSCLTIGNFHLGKLTSTNDRRQHGGISNCITIYTHQRLQYIASHLCHVGTTTHAIASTKMSAIYLQWIWVYSGVWPISCRTRPGKISYSVQRIFMLITQK